MATRMSEEAKSNVTKEVFLEHLRNCTIHRRAIDEANAAYRHALKRAKADGLNQKKLVEVMNMKRRDPDEVAAEEREKLRYMAWGGLPIGTQAEMFPVDDDQKLSDKSKLEQAKFDAEQRGYTHATHGGHIEECPFPQGSENAVAWIEGLRAGQSFMERSGKLEQAAKKKKGGSDGVVDISARRGRRSSGAAEAHA